MSLKKQIKKAYNGVHAPEDLAERIKQEFYQKDFQEDFDLDEYQEDTPQRPAFLKYLVYIAAMTAIGIGCVSALNYMEQFRTDFRPATRVNMNPPVSEVFSYGENSTADENTETAIVPNVVNYYVDYAVKVLAQEGFEPEITFEFSVDGTEENCVFSLTFNGEEIADKPAPIGSKITVHVNKGMDAEDSEILIPYVIGMKEEQAKSLLEYYGLNIEWSYEESDKPAGTVISQTPEKETMVKAGDTIYLTIAKGNSQTADNTTETATVPDVLGYHVQFALNLLHDAGFETQIYYENSEVPKDGVFSMTLDGEEIAGKNVPIGSRIALHVSDVPNGAKGMPDFLGMEEAEATKICEELGLMVKTEDEESPERAGTVIAQTLEAGSIIQQGMLITLVIASE